VQGRYKLTVNSICRNEAVAISGIVTVEVVVPVVGVFANTTTTATNKNLRKGLTYYIDQWK